MGLTTGWPRDGGAVGRPRPFRQLASVSQHCQRTDRRLAPSYKTQIPGPDDALEVSEVAMKSLKAGSASVDISPNDSLFLYGYPHVERYSVGVHDPLYSSALYLSDTETELIFVANDIIFVTKDLSARARRRIAEATGVPPRNVMVTATHTHSGPGTKDRVANENDPAVPQADRDYVQMLEEGIISAAVQACREAQPAEVGLAVADGTGVGTNRRDPSGARDPEVPVLMVKARGGAQAIGCMVVYSMHPTVLHEHSKLVSSDFPGFARRFLRNNVLGEGCPVLYHTGPAGNQSTRHVISDNTFAEAQRLGEALGKAIAEVIPEIQYTDSLLLGSRRCLLDLPRRQLPSVSEARDKLRSAAVHLQQLRAAGAPRQTVRTAEVDWFGAERAVALTEADQRGDLADAYESCLPAEIQILRVGPWAFVGWPGEVFVEYALRVKEHRENTFVIAYANGQLEGYIVTEEAASEGGYEASNALFGPEAGDVLTKMTLALLETWHS